MKNRIVIGLIMILGIFVTAGSITGTPVTNFGDDVSYYASVDNVTVTSVTFDVYSMEATADIEHYEATDTYNGEGRVVKSFEYIYITSASNCKQYRQHEDPGNVSKGTNVDYFNKFYDLNEATPDKCISPMRC